MPDNKRDDNKVRIDPTIVRMMLDVYNNPAELGILSDDRKQIMIPPNEIVKQ